VLGNLYREKGQVGRAIHEHQSLLQRPRLGKLEHANVQLCLGLDYRRGGFVDRAAAAFTEVLKLDPNSEAALVNLEKLQEDQHQWQEAYVTRQRLAQLAGPPDQPKSQSILAFLENEIGLQALQKGELDEAARRFEAAIDADGTIVTAFIHLGDVQRRQADLPAAVSTWERAIDVAPDRAYLALDRLQEAYQELKQPFRFAELCQRLTRASPREWRARLALARHLNAEDRPHEAFELLLEGLEHNPHALAIHQAIWNTLSRLDLPRAMVARYIEVTRQSVFYLDPHVCIRCRLPQHRTALAVPALPRMEYVRGGADLAGDGSGNGHAGGDALTAWRRTDETSRCAWR
jgi:lipopolysaccharide biosynthesis regulator YciM